MVDVFYNGLIFYGRHLGVGNEIMDKLNIITSKLTKIANTIGIRRFKYLALCADKFLPNYLDADLLIDNDRYHIIRSSDHELEEHNLDNDELINIINESINENFVSFVKSTAELMLRANISRLTIIKTHRCLITCRNGDHTEKCKSDEGDFVFSINAI